MAELYVIGNILGGTDFDETSQLYCKWKCVTEKNNLGLDEHSNAYWTHVDGMVEGCTQQATMQFDRMLIWSHPVDIHFSFTSTVGWPRFYVEVWHVDDYDRHRLKGYGTFMAPTTPGTHTIECVTWQPAKGPDQSVFEKLLPSRVELADGPDVLLGHEKRRDQWTTTAGSVHFELSILCRGLADKALRL